MSVVIPCRNERDTLAACLDALEGQELARSRFEILLVDGRSTDGCRELAERRGVAILEDPGDGPAAARNIGIRAARGRIVAFTDADCIPRFDWLARLVAAFERDPHIGGVAGALRLPRHTLLGRLEDNDARVNYRGYITSNVAYRRDVLLEVGGFDEDLQCAEDYDLAWRILDRGYRIVHDEGVVVLHDPPEVSGSVPRYLRKQFWYARHDIPAHARAILRAARARERRAGSARAIAGSLDALGNAAWLGAAAIGVARASPPWIFASAGAMGARSVRHVARHLRHVRAGTRELPLMAAIHWAKAAARGAGTIAGVADLARPSRWPLLRLPAEVGLAPPAAPRALRARGERSA